MTDGLFGATGSQLRFHPARLGEIDFTAVQRAIRHRVLRTAGRHGCLRPEAIADLESWEHGGGFSVHAGVLVEAEDRAALERLLRYCARPAFASERLEWECGDSTASATRVAEPRVRYMLPKPDRNGQTELVLTALQFLDRLAALIPPPRRHRHPYYGAFAPHAALRAWVSAHAGRAVPGSALMGAPDLSGMPSLAAAAAPFLAPPSMIAPPRRRASSLWARLIARIYECLPLSCRTDHHSRPPDAGR